MKNIPLLATKKDQVSIVITGPHCSGKTQLLNILAKVIECAGGSVFCTEEGISIEHNASGENILKLEHPGDFYISTVQEKKLLTD